MQREERWRVAAECTDGGRGTKNETKRAERSEIHGAGCQKFGPEDLCWRNEKIPRNHLVRRNSGRYKKE